MSWAIKVWLGGVRNLSFHALNKTWNIGGNARNFSWFLVLHNFHTDFSLILQNVWVLIDFSYIVAIWRSSDGPTGLSAGSPGAPREPSGTQITILAFLWKIIEFGKHSFHDMLSKCAIFHRFYTCFALSFWDASALSLLFSTSHNPFGR